MHHTYIDIVLNNKFILKKAEHFREIYDHKWTDASTVIEKSNGKIEIPIEILATVIKVRLHEKSKQLYKHIRYMDMYRASYVSAYVDILFFYVQYVKGLIYREWAPLSLVFFTINALLF